MLKYATAELGGQVLVERPTQGNVEDLHPTADAEDGDSAPQGQLQERHLERVSFWNG
jgi:hypothetical protein